MNEIPEKPEMEKVNERIESPHLPLQNPTPSLPSKQKIPFFATQSFSRCPNLRYLSHIPSNATRTVFHYPRLLLQLPTR